MFSLRGITVCVNYGPLLAITLERNMRHFQGGCLVITSPDDFETQTTVLGTHGARLQISDAMHRHGARFNKGLAFEECWDVHGRDGWWCIWDADIILPDKIPFELMKPDVLYGARRRILEDPSRWRPNFVWATAPYHYDGGPIGFTQIFNGDGIHVKDKRPWYDVSFTHAGGCDAHFMDLFPNHSRQVLAMDVLHLGVPDMNWFGCDQAGRDMMARFVHENGWHRAAKKHSMESVRRAGEIVERVDVPGYPKSTYELPFVARTKKRQP